MWQAVHMKSTCHRTNVCLLLCLLWSASAHAWGNVGHRITGLIADSLLSDSAHRQVQQLLGEETLSVAATYMDTQRAALSQHWHDSDKWHYDNQGICQQMPYCADGNCATRQIERFRLLLADRHASRADRALALRLLVHMLGDIHQPLHMADNADRGGNNIHVRLYAGGERYSLHEVFDTVLVRQLQGAMSIKAYATQLQQDYRTQLQQWQQGNLNDWAAQSHALAGQAVYGHLPGFACQHRDDMTVTLPDSYVRDAKRFIPEQLAKAGARIAYVLNRTLT